MDAKKIKEFRRRLSNEHEQLISSMSRSRSATDEIVGLQKTEDEGDLATISQEKEILSRMHESDFLRLSFIQKALKALDRGDYGECSSCGEEIGEKRLMAVPWALTCIRCQEATEAERLSRTAPTATRTADNEF